MAQFLTEDIVRDNDKIVLGFDDDEKGVEQGTGQLTTFNQLGIKGISDKPDGWYLPKNKKDIAIILETKNSDEDINNTKNINELKKNCDILLNFGYSKVIGLLHNGYKTKGFLNNEEIEVPEELQHKSFYIKLVTNKKIDKETIYQITMRINNCLHSEFGIKNLYHRMIFTACALVAKRYDAFMQRGMDYSTFHNSIISCLNKELIKDKNQNMKLDLLVEVFSEIKMNLNVNSEDAKEKEHVKDLIGDFIEWIEEISSCLDSSDWNGEDVMAIFFNEFNRYKKKSESGQVFTPEHITSFMYRLIDCNQNDVIGDFCCGSGAFLVKSMALMMKESGGPDTEKAKRIKQKQLYGIEYDREIFALACANMLIHRDGKTNLTQMDTRTEQACEWIKSKPITKVLMNPPYENKYGCMTIVENVLDNVKVGTECAFILPDKKLEKASKKQIDRILSNHTLTKIIKLPEPLFFGVGVTTSIFVFKTGQPQNGQEIFSCYIEDDGLETVKNQGRQDIKNKWHDIEDYWIDSIKKLRDEKYNTAQWIKPEEHLSYQMPEKPFEISEEDFKKTCIQYIMFKKGIDSKDFEGKLLNSVLYSSNVALKDDNVIVSIKRIRNN